MLFERCDEATQDKIVKELVGNLSSTRTASAAASGGEMATFQVGCHLPSPSITFHDKPSSPTAF